MGLDKVRGVKRPATRSDVIRHDRTFIPQHDNRIMTSTNALTLPPNQERAAFLLAAGKPVQEVADELGVHRSTLWQWRKHENFQAVYNAMIEEVQHGMKESLLALGPRAIDTLQITMACGTDAARLRAALYVLDRIERLQSGETDPWEIVRKKHTTSELERARSGFEIFDEVGYRRRCGELGLEP